MPIASWCQHKQSEDICRVAGMPQNNSHLLLSLSLSLLPAQEDWHHAGIARAIATNLTVNGDCD